MVTGDHLATAKAIAKQAGIYDEARGDIVMEGPEFRALKPDQVDQLLPNLAVLARSSPDDKFLLVTRLNGHNLPTNAEEWQQQATTRYGKDWAGEWETHKNEVLPGYTARGVLLVVVF
jgi:hypothetical protein